MTESTTAMRTVDNVQVPITGTYALDGSHSEVGFKVRHLGIGRVKGRFSDINATITVAEDYRASSVEATIAIASIDTRDTGRDEHLLSPDFFDAANHPTMTFVSDAIPAYDPGGAFTLTGSLTIKDVTVPVALAAVFEGALIDPWGNPRIGFSAKTEINREDFGLTWNQAIEAGGVVVGKTIQIEIEAEAVRVGD